MPLPAFTVTLSEDAMEAWICFHTEAPVPVAELRAGLEAAGVVAGIDEFLLQDLAEAHRVGQHYCIARGLPPDEGLEFAFALTPDSSPRRLPDGRVDFFNLNTVQNVVQQQILVSALPPEARKPGLTVTGVPLPPPKHAVSLPKAGTNVALAPDGQALIALINGYPSLRGDTLHVEPTYTLSGNVDFAVGNLTCVSHLVVTGDVKGGFSIKAAGDVTVHGVVEAARIEAGGHLRLYSNVFGNHRASLRSGQSVEAAFIDAATVEARRDIVLARGARHSTLHAGGSIRVQGSASQVVGGELRAGLHLLLHDVGSERAIPTRLCLDPGACDVARHRQGLEALALLLDEDERQLATGAADRAEGARLGCLLRRARAALDELQAYLRHRQQHQGLWPLGAVVVLGTAYPGVSIHIGEASYQVTRPMQQTLFTLGEAGVQARPLADLAA